MFKLTLNLTFYLVRILNGDSHVKRLEMLIKKFELNPKETDLGVFELYWIPKRPFVAKKKKVTMVHPRLDKNLRFTPISEMLSIPDLI